MFIRDFILKILGYPRYKIEDVFTPAKIAEVNYINRKDIDTQLLSEICTPGKQIIVFGHSGSGKTSSVRKLLSANTYRFIRTQCESRTSFEQLLLNAFDQLDVYIMSEKIHKHTKTNKGELISDYTSIKVALDRESVREDINTFARLLPPQLTPQKLAEFMGVSNIVWVIEDFHKISQEEKKRIADVIKIFVDNANDYPSSKLICIGACESAHELIQLSPDIGTRVAEISVPLLSDEEIKQLILNGFRMLNIIPQPSLVEKLVHYSDRLGSCAHQMCLDICKGEKINRTVYGSRTIKDSSFEYAVDGFIKRSADTFKSIYDAAIKNELGWYVLKVFSGDSKSRFSIDDIIKKVNKRGNTFDEEEIKDKLLELMSPEFNIVYYNKNSEKYALSSPFWHHFLKMKFGIENSESRKSKKNKRNPHLRIDDYNADRIIDKLMQDFVRELINK